MPPSGFHKNQASQLTSFLTLCLNDLIKEAKSLSISYVSALEKEITNIEVITREDCDRFQYFLLMFVREFYVAVLKERPVDEDSLLVVGQDVCDKVDELILAVHVPEIKK